MDDIAKQAGVAKATVYLRWKTREELFTALIIREAQAMAQDLESRIRGDPEGMTLHGFFKHRLAQLAHPIMLTIFVDETGLLGAFAKSRIGAVLTKHKFVLSTVYLEVLREHGLLGTDRSVEEQFYLLSTLFIGFLHIDRFLPETQSMPGEQRASLLTEVIRRLFEPEVLPSPHVLQEVGIRLLSLMQEAQETARRELETE